MNKALHLIVEQFVPQADDVSIFPYGNGLINDTYLVTAQKTEPPQQRFILQLINQQVFEQPDLIMNNMENLFNHIASKPLHDMKLQWPALLKTSEQQNCYVDKRGNSWRAMHFIENSRSVETITNQTQAEQVGLALGHFHYLVSDLQPSILFDTLPGFHITPNYLVKYQHANSLKKLQPNADEQYCHDIISTYQHQVGILEDAKQRGLLQLRIIHGDPKLNNFLFENQSERIISLIDLDTVNPGLIHYDIADCLRSCCQIKKTQLDFELDICAVILKNYIAETKGFLTQHDFAYLYPAIELLPFELGIRFFTDYLQGNKYFKVSDPQQNLYRAIDQFHLMQSIKHQEDNIRDIIKHLQNTHTCNQSANYENNSQDPEN